MAEKKGRPPDFILKAAPKEDVSAGHRIGAGWKNDDGRISIILDHFVRLDGRDEIMINLFPKDGDRG